MRINLFVLLFWLTFIAGCSRKIDNETARQEIIQLLQQERKAHFDRNVDLFVSEFSDSMISVNKGKVTMNTPAENKKRIEPYFSRVKFIKWDDLAEPLIRISDDCSLAYAVIQKEVILTYPDTSGKPLYDTSYFAWTSIYRKQNGEWKVECNVSTNK
ncbi:MAG TPA: hypothetical protein VIZ28_16945 [Chitinophagaceae bacterium]